MRLLNKLVIAMAIIALFGGCSNGSKETKDYSSEPTSIVIKAAKDGDVNALVELVSRYAEDESWSIEDYVEAFKWCTKAAEKGDAKAQYSLGICYDRGIGTSRNSKEAARWFTKSAEQGYAPAQITLGECYENGIGVERKRNDEEAVRWYRKAADQGLAPAQFYLGRCYYNGWGVSQDYAEAVRWFTKSAEQGFGPAQISLGDCYSDGNGVAKNQEEAFKWWTKAAEQGYEVVVAEEVEED